MNVTQFYSQFGEDKFLHKQIFKGKRDGVFCELGAMNGVQWSNTCFFEEQLNWTGYLVEPDPVSYSTLAQNRPKSKCYNYAISQEKGEVEMLINPNQHAVAAVKEGISQGFYQKWHTYSQKVMVPSAPFRDILTSKECPHIDLWSIDVEGRELDVLDTWDWNIKVDYILIETLDHFYKETNDKCRGYLMAKGYRFLQKVAHNELWVSKTL